MFINYFYVLLKIKGGDNDVIGKLEETIRRTGPRTENQRRKRNGIRQ